MSQNNNLTMYSVKTKDPYLQLRYARGAGDVVACILHSKMVGWLTKLITGKDKPCTKCFKRGNALNVLLPIKVWRLFFKTEGEYIKSFKEALEKAGYSVNGSPESKALSSTKLSSTPLNTDNTFVKLSPDQEINPNYTLMASSDNYIGDFFIKTQIFKIK